MNTNLKKSAVLVACACLASIVSHAGWLDFLRPQSSSNTTGSAAAPATLGALSQTKVASGLKEALSKGVNHAIARRLHAQKSPARGQPHRQRVARLTSRELEVLQLIAEGQPNKQVAGELGISIKTVEKHRQSMMQKLNIHDVTGLTRYAIGAGIIESSVQLTIK